MRCRGKYLENYIWSSNNNNYYYHMLPYSTDVLVLEAGGGKVNKCIKLISTQRDASSHHAGWAKLVGAQRREPSILLGGLEGSTAVTRGS